MGVWLITWARGNDTGFHDHDLSCGAVAVVQGAIVEERLVVGGPPRRLPHSAGEAFGFDASHVHRMRKDDAALAVSIHAYSPPLSRMGAYEVDADGALCRRSICVGGGVAPGGGGLGVHAVGELGADALGRRHELARGGQQVAIAVPRQADEPRRQPDVELDRAHAGCPGSTLSRGSSAAPMPAATSPWIVSSSLERKTTRGVPRRWVSGRVTSRTRS